MFVGKLVWTRGVGCPKRKCSVELLVGLTFGRAPRVDCCDPSGAAFPEVQADPDFASFVVSIVPLRAESMF